MESISNSTISPIVLESTTLNTSVFLNTTDAEHVNALLNSFNIKNIMLAFINGLACIFIIFGGSIPYVFQYLEINDRKDARGFSLYVCLTLCIANILRILFWFGNHFDTPLLIQSSVMLITMFIMLEISVRMNKKLVSKSQWTSIWSKFYF
uniref:PQ-loop repeat-containing protein n=1 Tax=Parastrongyloides trichosuri TaxID=131310 RepID=A0A0N4ZN72_PARTI